MNWHTILLTLFQLLLAAILQWLNHPDVALALLGTSAASAGHVAGERAGTKKVEEKDNDRTAKRADS